MSTNEWKLKFQNIYNLGQTKLGLQMWVIFGWVVGPSDIWCNFPILKGQISQFIIHFINDKYVKRIVTKKKFNKGGNHNIVNYKGS